LFPKGRLPEKYDDLHAEWAQLDGFVAGLAESTLAGKKWSPEEIEPYGYAEFRQRLERLEAEHPDIASPYIEAFQHLEDMLELLRAITRNG